LRALRSGVEPGDDPRGEPVTPDRIVDDDRVGGRVGRGDCHPVGDVMKRGVEGRGRLAGQPAYRKAITAIRRDRDIQNGVTHAEGRESVAARRPRVRRQHQDAGVIVADAQLAG